MPSAPRHTTAHSGTPGSLDPSEADLRPEQLQALEALMAGLGISAAARVAGVGRRTLHRWLAEDAAFIAMHRQLQTELRDAIQANMQVLAGVSVQVLRRALLGRKATVSEKIRVATFVLGQAARESDLGPADEEGVALELRQARQRRGLQRYGVEQMRAMEDLGRDLREPPAPDPEDPAEEDRSNADPAES